MFMLSLCSCRSESRGASPMRATADVAPTALRDSLVERASPSDTSVRIVMEAAEFRLGTVSSSHSAEFGWIAAAAFTPDSGIVVLDALNDRLSRYSRRGDPIISVGRHGEGPGEFQEPEALAQLDSATLLVLDSRARRLDRYAIGTNGLKYVSADPLTDWPGAICAIGEAVVGLYYDRTDKTIVHRLNRVATTAASFGQALFGEPELNIAGTTGQLACTSDQHLVVVAPDRTGDIFAYRTDGTLRWRTHLSRFRPSLFKLIPGGSMLGFAPGQKFRDVTIAAVPISSHFLLVQLGTKMLGKPFVGDFESVDSRILRLSDGVEVGAQDDLPPVANAMAGRMLTFGTDNDVWVEVRRFYIEHDPALPRH
jgi:hypothetical protein